MENQIEQGGHLNEKQDEKPETGRIPSLTARRYIKIRPSQNEGIDTPINDINRIM